MTWRHPFRHLWGVRRRRPPITPRVVEFLEARVLLTDDAIFDVVYLDVLKGQNFSQTTTGAATLQSGSPFHFHTSVHSPTGFTSSATLQPPTGSVKTLTQQNGSSNFLSLDQSFTTKSLLDAAFASGNYKPTIMHPLSVQFSPSLDVSAAAGQSVTLDSQVVAPNSSGVFHEVWSPITPAVDVDGTVTATHFSATLKGHTNASLTGTISADWNGTQYVGTYTFNGASGNVSIPEAIVTTLSLPTDAYPNAPHITNFTAAQTLNPAADFTLTWDAFAGGAADDLITLFIFDGNNQVFHTDAIPLPSSSPHLDGTATSFVLPKNTLLANKTYNAQLWFTNFTSIDTTSFPGAKATTGYYIATNFTMKTGTAVDTSPADVVAYYVSKAQEFVQTSAGAPVLNNDTPFDFVAHVQERPADGSTVNDATITVPTNTVLTGPQDLQTNDDEGWDFFREFDTKAQLDAALKTGSYKFAINTVNQGLKNPAVTLPAEAYPVTPHISNWADAQLIDASSDFTLNWDTFTGGTTDDFIQVSIVNQSGETVLETQDFWEANPLRGTAKSLVIPAGTLEAGETYSAELLFANASTLDRTTYKNSLGTTAYSKITTFSLQTIPPEGILQFQTTGFSVNENADPATATITVTRIGGSAGEVQIDYATSNGSATADSDYTAASGTLTFADGVTSQTFDIPILDDTQSEGHETVTLQLTNPTNGVILGTRATATLTILDNELTFGPGKFIDSDGDQYTVVLSGPGQARIAVNDPDGDGKGPIAAILLSNTTSTTSVTITVTKAITGDGEVPIGRVTGAGSLSSFTAAKSDLTGSGIALDGVVGQLTVDDVLNGADIVVGGVLANSTKFTLGDVAAGTELRSGATVSALTAQTFLGDLIQAPAITALTVNAGSFPTDLNVVNAIKTLTLKAGGASGDWLAGSFGTVSITGGDFSGTLRATATLAQLGTSPAISALTMTGGNLVGRVQALGKIGTLKVLKSATNLGGSISDAVLAAKGIDNLTVDRDVLRSLILAGANLGNDFALGGIEGAADRFDGGTLGAVTIRGVMTASALGAGFDPLDSLINNENDAVIGGNASEIKTVTVTGLVAASNFFVAGRFSGAVKFNNVTVNPASDTRFFVGGGTSVLELTRSRVDAISGDTVVLPGGSSVEIPAGALDVDQIATLARVSTMSVKPPSGLLTDVGSSLSLAFTAVPGAPSAADEPEGEPPTDANLKYSIPLGDNLPPKIAGSIPIGDIVDLTGKHNFIGLQGTVDVPNRRVTYDVPLSAQQALNSNLAQWQVRTGLANLSVFPLIQPPRSQYWNPSTKKFVDLPPNALPTIVKPGQKTLVVVHGMASNVTKAFASDPDCMNEIMRKGGYQQVIGFNYDWTQNINASGQQLAALLKDLKTLGITKVDVEAHSEGGPVSLSGVSRRDGSGQPIDIPVIEKMVLLGTPIYGTPAANQGVLLATALMNLSFGAFPSPLVAGTIQDLLNRGFASDLILNSPVLKDIRNEFRNLRPDTKVFTLAGSDGFGSTAMAALSILTKPIFALLGQATDGIIGESSVHGRASSPEDDWGLGENLIEMGTLPLAHDELECDDKAIDRVASFMNPPEPKVIVNPTSGLRTTESGGQATFEIVLSTRPQSPVTVYLVSLDPDEGIANHDSLEFTKDNWFFPQLVTVTGQDDDVADGNQVYTILVGPAVSDDLRYHGQNPDNVTITNLDDDRFLSINDVTKVEGNSGTTTFTFTISLAAPSSDPISVDYATSDGSAKAGTDYTAAGPVRITFSPGQTSKTITVSVKGDLNAESDETFAVNLLNPTIGAQIVDAQGLGTILNDDVPGILVSPTSGLVTTEAGGTATFTIKLATPPTADVTINLTSDDISEGTVSPTSVTFTPTNWNTAKTITVKGVNDSLVDGDIVYHIVTEAAISADPDYSGRDASDVTVTNRDNDSVPTASLTGKWVGSGSLTNPLQTFPVTYTLQIQNSGTSITGSISASGQSRTISGTVTGTHVVINVNNLGLTQTYRLEGEVTSPTQMRLGVLIIGNDGGRTTSLNDFIFTKIS